MRILFLTQLFEPEPALKGLAFVRALEKAGHEVEVVTGFPNYPGGKVYSGYRIRPWQREILHGVRVLRLANCPSHDLSGLRRAWHFLSFFLSALLYVLLFGRRFDVIYVGHPGVTTGLAALLGGYFWRVPYVLDIQDLWPDSLVASGIQGSSRMARFVAPTCNLVHRRAKHIVAQSEGMARELVARGVFQKNVSVVYNWAADAPQHQVANTRRRPGPFQIVYAGNFGRLQNLQIAIEAAELVAPQNPDIELWLVGGGIEKQTLETLVKEKNLKNVRFLDRVSPTELVPILSSAGALLLHLARHPLLQITIPSKSQFYLAVGKPILAAVDGEAARIMADSGAAIVVPPEAPDKLAKAMLAVSETSDEVLQRMAFSGRAHYDSQFSFDQAILHTLQILNKANS
jgi:colanic acid biosynthesis glycosyl transferase WcaI